MSKIHPTPRVFNPKNKNKYIGDKLPISRSNLESKMMLVLDYSNKVLQWASEQPLIPYVHPVRSLEEGKQIIWNYHPDFLIKLTDGKKIWYELVEIKPSKQTRVPKPMGQGRSKKLVESESKTYAVNAAKWEQAIKLCEQRGWIFRIITEKTLSQYLNSIQ